jgi:hypothetical protein
MQLSCVTKAEVILQCSGEAADRNIQTNMELVQQREFSKHVSFELAVSMLEVYVVTPSHPRTYSQLQ